MNFHFANCGFLFLGASIITAVITVIAWRQRNKSGGIWFAILMASISEWSFAAGMEAIVISQSAKVLWSQIEYIGLVATPPSLLHFTITYIQQKNWLNKRRMIALWIPPVVILTLTMTNQWHGLIWSGFTPGSVSSNVLIYHRGPLFWLTVGYAYLIIFVSFLIMLRIFLLSRFPVKQQLGVMLISICFPMISSVLYVSRTSFLQGMDITPLGFAVSGLMISWSLFRFSFLDIIPVGRSAMVEKMPTGMLVIDEKSRIADINPAAVYLLDIKECKPTGQPVDIIFKKNHDLLRLLSRTAEVQAEIFVVGKENRLLDVSLSLLKDSHQQIQGKLVLFQDITERKKMEDELFKSATMDSLTGAKSRGYFMDKMTADFHKSKRYNRQLAFALMDIDHFKKINDSHGHLVGDEVLKEIVNKCHATIRGADNFGRLGGEEFGLLFPETDSAGAMTVCERLRRDINNMPLLIENKRIKCSVSIGIAVLNNKDITVDGLINRADKALYDAKRKGRNRTSIARTQSRSKNSLKTTVK